MSNTILNYLNNEIKLSKIIQNVEKDFSNGYFFAELLQKVGYLKTDLKNFKKEPASQKEIDENFNNLKEQLNLIGVHLEHGTIKSIYSCEKNVASNLIYKIRTKIFRKNIGFDEILDKIQLHEKENINLNNKFMYSTMVNFRKTKSNIHKSRSSSNFSEISNFRISGEIPYIDTGKKKNKTRNNFFNKKDLKIGLSSAKKKVKLKPLKKFGSASEINDLKNNLCKNIEIKKSDNKNRTGKFFSPKIYLKRNLNEISEHEYDDFSNNNIIRGPKSINMNSKLENINQKNHKKFFNNEEEKKFINYSCLEHNSLKVGIDIKEIDPKMKKHTIDYNSDLILAKVVSSRLREKLKEQEEREKKKKEEKKLLTEEEKIYKYSILKNDKDNEGKTFFIQLDKEKQLYKMNEYEKKRKIKFPLKSKKMLEELQKNKKFMSNFILGDEVGKRGYKTSINFYENASSDFVPLNFFEEINKNDIIERIKNLEKKQLKKEKDFVEMEEIINLIVDLTEQCYKYQNKKKTEFVNLPEYKKWIQQFIDGKTCLKLPERRKSLITLDTTEINNPKKKSIKKSDKEIKENVNKIKAEKVRNEILKSDFCANELIDYLYGRGYWSQKLYVPDDVYGSQVHIYQILGDSITSMIASGKIVLQGIKPSTFLKMKNEEFELKEDEKENILIPKENKRNQIFGELIELNYDNNPNLSNYLNLNSSVSEFYSEILNANEYNNKNNYCGTDLSYIPIKICLLGNSFSGRKTQAALLSSKYPELKIYSINKIVNFYSDEYQRLYINNENNNSKKIGKKSQAELIKEKEREEEIKKFDEVKGLIEDYSLKKVNDLSDETKLKLLLREILKDFPYKEEKEIQNEIHKRNKRKIEIENEIKKNKIELEQDKKNKKANISLQQLQAEYDKLNNESYSGFIIVDYPNNYEQLLKLEEFLSGFIQEIDKPPDKRDLFLNYLTNILDKPYYNISYICPEIINYLRKGNKNSKSIFNHYIWLKANEEDIINRSLNRMLDPQTGIIYQIDNDPPPPNDKKLNERLVPVTEPTPDQLKEEIKLYNLEIPKIIEFLNNFKNLDIINKNDKTEINKDIENEIVNSIKKFEDRENKDIIGDLMKTKDLEENSNINYFLRLNEIKKKLRKEISENILENWIDFKEKYIFNIKEFIYNIDHLKNDIILKMGVIQDNFIEFLNSPSEKKKTINMFLRKYDSFLENYYSIKNHELVKEEIDKDIISLTESLWGIIQERKKDAINDLNLAKKSPFIDKQLDFFWELLSNLFFVETENYIKRINIIKQFYFEFDINRYSDKFPYEFKIKKDDILKGTDKLPIYSEPKNENNKKTKSSFKRIQDDNKVYILSPKIDKIYKNCFKMLFQYNKKMNEIEEKERENYFLNTSELSNLSRNRKKFKKLVSKKENSIQTINVINQEEEIKAALLDEKIKYKLKLVFLKYFGEKLIVEIKNIAKLTFQNMDKWIIKSVESQNNAMNIIINKIKENLSVASSLGIDRTFLWQELDIFNVYEKYMPKFKEITLKNFTSIKDEDKTFDINDLYKIYLDVKIYEIQENYVTLNSINDILIKKHIYDYNSKGLMNYFKEMPYQYLNKFIKKFLIKTSKGQNLVRIDRLFTILVLINSSFPNKEQISSLNREVKDKLKFNNFLSKNDFLKCNFWFSQKENDQSFINKKNYKLSSNSNLNQFRRMSYLKSKRESSTSSLEEQMKEFNKEPFDKISKILLKKNSKIRINNIEENINNIIIENEKKNIKEILFEINKNYNNEIDFYEFIDIITLKFFLKMKKKKSMRIKHKESKINVTDVAKSLILTENNKIIGTDENNNIDSVKISNPNIENKNINDSKQNYKNSLEEPINKNNQNINKEAESIKDQKIDLLVNKENQINEEKMNINNSPNIYTYFEKLIKD